MQIKENSNQHKKLYNNNLNTNKNKKLKLNTTIKYE